jgi:hypothetical protein
MRFQDGSSRSKLVLRPEDISTGPLRPSDLLIECLASHPELGDDFISYSHVVEILCKMLLTGLRPFAYVPA